MNLRIKNYIKEFLVGLILFGSVGFCMYGIGEVQAAEQQIEVPVAGATVAMMEGLELEYIGELYSTGNVNVRKEPTTNSEVVCTLTEYEPIEVWEETGLDWYRTKSGYYIRKDLLTNEIPSSAYYQVYATFKSYTDYRAVTSTSSPQYKIQQEAYTGDYGLRMASGRYCVAFGSGITRNIGQKVDLICEDGSIISCVSCDQKSDRHTDSGHIYTVVTGTKCATEFYVDTGALYSAAKSSGNISSIPGFDLPVVGIRVYDDYI